MKVCWQCRYSSCEMMYLELGEGEVRIFLDHSPRTADRYSFDRVLAGEIDAEISNLFGSDAVDEVKQAIRQRTTPPPAR